MSEPGCLICGDLVYVDELCSRCYDSYRQSCVMGHHCPLDKNRPANVFRWAVMRTKRMMRRSLQRGEAPIVSRSLEGNHAVASLGEREVSAQETEVIRR